MPRKTPTPDAPSPDDSYEALKRLELAVQRIESNQREILACLHQIVRPAPANPAPAPRPDGCEALTLGRYGSVLVVLHRPVHAAAAAEASLEITPEGKDPIFEPLPSLAWRFLVLLLAIRNEHASPRRPWFTKTPALAKRLKPSASGGSSGREPGENQIRALVKELRTKLRLLGVKTDVILNVRGDGYALGWGDDTEFDDAAAGGGAGGGAGG